MTSKANNGGNKNMNLLRKDFEIMKQQLNYKPQKGEDKNETRFIYKGTGKGKLL